MKIDSERFLLCHSVPGRMRLKLLLPRFSREVAQALEHRIGSCERIRGVEVRHRTGSVILHYDSNKVGPEEVLDHLAKVLQEKIPQG